MKKKKVFFSIKKGKVQSIIPITIEGEISTAGLDQINETETMNQYRRSSGIISIWRFFSLAKTPDVFHWFPKKKKIIQFSPKVLTPAIKKKKKTFTFYIQFLIPAIKKKKKKPLFSYVSNE